jgi:histidinol dehydrogenase
MKAMTPLYRRFHYTQHLDWMEISRWLGQRQAPSLEIEEQVLDILEQVRRHGDEALLDYTRRFDCPDFSLSQLRIPVSAIEQARRMIPEEELSIIEQAAENITRFHEKQRESSWIDHSQPGIITGQMVHAIRSAGLYVPGGQSGETPLVSSLLMNAIPAKVAGVERIAVVSPPREDGSLNPYTLAAAAILNLDEVFAVGSAWSVGGLAYGTQTLPGVDLIAGPGNIHVTTAKRLLIGQVGIDLIAGPSEIVILADETARPDWLAADLLSQAEHDPLASALLISPDEGQIQAVQDALESQLGALPRHEAARKSLTDWGALISVDSLEAGVELINLLAPEHLELCIDDPWSELSSIRNAGAIFLGHHTPEPVGDYFAGPNHVLPTMGSARFASALSVQDFCTKSSIISANPAYLERHAGSIARLARLEGLEAHARSVEVRIQPGLWAG